MTRASMLELVDKLDLGSSAAMRAGSSPVTRTVVFLTKIVQI